MDKVINRIKKYSHNPESYSGSENVWKKLCERDDIDVYDAALWSSIVPLSEWSVANGSTSIEVPDFTSGAWKTNGRGMDINLQKGGTTKFI